MFVFCLLIAWYLVYRAGGDLATGAARVTAAAADRLAGTAARLGERGEGLRQRATATAQRLRDRPAPTTPRTRAGQGLGEDLAGALGTGIGAVIGWLRLVWVDATAAAESAQARRGPGPHAMWWRWPSGNDPQAPIQATAERLDRDPAGAPGGATSDNVQVEEDQAVPGTPSGPPAHTTSTSGWGDRTGEGGYGGAGPTGATSTADESPVRATAERVDNTTSPATDEATAVDTDPRTPIQASAHRLDTPTLPAASSDRLAITDGRNGMETAAESGLGAYLSYASSMSSSCQQGVSSVESTLGALESQDWSGVPVDALRTAMEALGTAAGAFDQAQNAFQSALAVRESYAANSHAGTKESVLSD